MKNLKWQIGLLVGAMIVIAIILLGQKPVEQIIIAEPTSGGIYIEGMVGTPVRFNPLVDYLNQIDRDVDALIFSQLIKFDSYGNPVGDLAQSLAISIDSDVINVTLRDNALWHDGVPLTSQDIIFTVNLFTNPELPIREDIVNLWSQVEVIAFDALNIQFKLPESYIPFYDFLAFPVLPKHILENLSTIEILNGLHNFSPIGSGPYKFENLEVEDAKIIGVTLVANQDYYLDPPLIDQISFRYFNEFDQAISAYRDGTISGIGHVPNENLEQALRENSLNVYTSFEPKMGIILLNLDRLDVSFFQELEIRKALVQGLNRQWLINELMAGQAVVAEGPIMPGTWAYKEDVSLPSFDSDSAITTLKEQGFVLPAEGGQIRENEGKRLAFDLAYLDSEINAQLVSMISEYWENIGVGVTLVPFTDKFEFISALESHTFDAAFVELDLSESPDPDPYIFWHQAMISEGQNYGQWNDRRASEYLENARITSFVSERTRLYKNFQSHFSIEIPAIPLYFPMYSFAVGANVHGITVGALFDPSDRFNGIGEWFLRSQPIIESDTSSTDSP